jgi:hypothetical protein
MTMSQKKNDEQPEQPMIRFGGEWIPAHNVWNKMETANVVADVIERFNNNFPKLSNNDTREVVPLVRQRLKDIELQMPVKARQPDLGPIAAQLLDSMSPEEAVEILTRDHDAQLDVLQLIQLAGEQNYAQALSREAAEYERNLISPDQTARLWNDLARPAPGGGLWTSGKISALLDGGT